MKGLKKDHWGPSWKSPDGKCPGIGMHGRNYVGVLQRHHRLPRDSEAEGDSEAPLRLVQNCARGHYQSRRADDTSGGDPSGRDTFCGGV